MAAIDSDIDATPRLAEGLDARRALDVWWREALDLRQPPRPVEDWCRSFPYDTVRRAWHDVGRAGVDAGSIAAVDGAATVLATEATAPEPPTWAWFLSLWLPMLVDIGHDRCTYATYVGTPILEGLLPSGRESTGGAPLAPEASVALLLAHLLRFESEGSTAGDDAAEVRTGRVVALTGMLLEHGGSLLGGLDREHRLPNRPAPTDEASRRAVVETGAALADDVLRAAPADACRQLELLSLPNTTVHDEHMFIRVLQLFETVFSAMLQRLTIARTLLEAGDVAEATERIDDARLDLERAIPFFRILGTMQPEAFAHIRIATPGASGLQSTNFKGIELVCSRQTEERLASPGYELPVIATLVEAEGERPTIEALAQRLAAGPDRPVPPLLTAMRGLNHHWGQWRKAHWATAIRLIGDVPGTGGTDGAAYLRAHLSRPLFPMFA